MTTVLQGTLVLADHLVDRGQIVLEGDRIAAVVEGGRRSAPTHDYGDAYILPGLMDLHVHGIAGADVMDARPESIETMSRRFAAHGVTGFLASTVTGSLEETRRAIEVARDATKIQPDGCAQVLGIHLEGPFINPEFNGMQNRTYILQPDEDVLNDLLEWGGGQIRRVSLAPEMPGADRLIRRLRADGVKVSIAHTGATFDEAQEAVLLGTEHVTHCFNAMTGLHHRQPGVAGAAMLSSDLYAELVGDGIHVHPAVMRLVIGAKGRERVILVTDAMSATDMPDGLYEFGGNRVEVKDRVARLENGRLASSTLTMEVGVRNLVHLCGMSVVDAVHLGSTTPARAMGFDRKGALLAGYDADLAVLDRAFVPQATWVAGHEAYSVRT